MTRIALVFLALLVPRIAAAEEGPALDVSAHVEGTDGGGIGVGVPFRLVVEARHAPGNVALLPETLPFDAGKVAERRASRRHARSGDGASEVDRYEIELLAFEAGALELPAIPLALGSTRAATKPIELEIATGFSQDELPIATSTIPQAIAELERMAAQDPSPVPVLVDDKRPLFAAAGLAGLALLAWIAWRMIRARRARAGALPIPAPPPRPAHEVALERLARLRAAGYLERGEKKAFFSELSEILREYAGARYGFDSLDLTVDELMLELARAKTGGLDLLKLRWILDRADMVKFAKLEVDLTEAASAIADADAIVERTRPQEATPGDAEVPEGVERQHAS